MKYQHAERRLVLCIIRNPIEILGLVHRNPIEILGYNYRDRQKDPPAVFDYVITGSVYSWGYLITVV
jgi:hypothetical protein